MASMLRTGQWTCTKEALRDALRWYAGTEECQPSRYMQRLCAALGMTSIHGRLTGRGREAIDTLTALIDAEAEETGNQVTH